MYVCIYIIYIYIYLIYICMYVYIIYIYLSYIYILYIYIIYVCIAKQIKQHFFTFRQTIFYESFLPTHINIYIRYIYLYKILYIIYYSIPTFIYRLQASAIVYFWGQARQGNLNKEMLKKSEIFESLGKNIQIFFSKKAGDWVR